MIQSNKSPLSRSRKSMERTHQSLGILVLAASALALSVCSKAGAAPPLEAYGNLPQVEYMRVSPSGSRVAMVGVIAEKRQLVLAEVAGGQGVEGGRHWNQQGSRFELGG
jgi:hypothetical protein